VVYNSEVFKENSLCRIRDSCTGCFDEIEIRLAGMFTFAQTGRRFFDFFNLHGESPFFVKNLKRVSAVFVMIPSNDNRPESARIHRGTGCLNITCRRLCQFFGVQVSWAAALAMFVLVKHL